MFFNAGVQGNVRMIKAISHSSKVRTLVGGIIGTGFAFQMLAYMTGGDDDTGQPYIDGIPDYIKERNMVFMKPGTNGEHFKLPLFYGYGVFYNIGAEFARAVHTNLSGRKYEVGKAAIRLTNTAMSSFNPLRSATLLQSITPTVADPIAMVAENKSWMGSDLMPKENSFGINKADAYRTWRTTSDIPKHIAQALHRLTGGRGEYDNSAVIDISPETIELMYDQLTGSMGRFVKNSISTPLQLAFDENNGTIEPNKIPFVNKFYGAWSDRSISERYYQKAEEVERFKKDLAAADLQTKKELSGDSTKRLIEPTKETEKILSKLREARNKASANGKPTKLIDEKIVKIQTEYLKRSKQWEN
jgi:hypothetical protein